MADFTKTTNFTAKDSLLSGDPDKVVRGAELDTEFDAIETAIATKYDSGDTAAFASGTTIGNLTLANGSITDSSGSITFGNENLSTTGTLASGALTVTGNIVVSGTVDGRDVAADGTKLDGIETGADVTDATNVDAAGAVMNSDTSTAAMSFVIDEDNMVSNSATKVPTQQSTKKYVDDTVVAIGALTVTGTPVANDFARFTSASQIEGRSYAEVRADLSLEIGTDVQAEISGASLTSATVATGDKVLVQDADDSDNLKTVTAQSIADLTVVDKATASATLAPGQQTTLTLSSAITSGAPLVDVTKEVAQTGVTANRWDAAAGTFETVDSAYATTLDITFEGLQNSTYASETSLSGVSETSAKAVTFNSDGTKMFVLGDTNNAVYEYTLSTAYDVSSATYDSQFSVTSQDTVPSGLAFSSDGTKMFVTGQNGSDVNEYTLSTGFDVSSASFVDSFSVSGQISDARGLAFNSDGTKMFVCDRGANDDVNEYTLSTGWDVSTASFVDAFDCSGQDADIRGVAFNSDGTKMYVSGVTNNKIFIYTLSTGFDVSSASYSTNSIDLTGYGTSPSNAFVDQQAERFICFPSEGTGKIFRFDPPSVLVLGTGSWASGDVGKTVTANSGEFIITSVNAGSAVYTEVTAPTSETQVASGDWTMNAVVYDSTDDVIELSGISNLDDIANKVLIGNSGTEISTYTALPEGLDLKNDGSTLLVIDNQNNRFLQWTLTTPYDITTLSSFASYTHSAQFTGGRDCFWSNDGTNIFGINANQIYGFGLSTPWNISTASYSSNLGSVSGQVTDAQGLCFNGDGTKVYVCSGSGGSETTFQYSLSTAWDLTGISYDSKSLVHTAQDGEPHAIYFNADGTKFFMLGRANDAVFQYNLTTAYDISTATYSGISTSIASEETAPSGLCIANNGTKMYMCGTTSDKAFEYTIGEVVLPPSGYHSAISFPIDTTYWTDWNSVAITDAPGDGSVNYAVSVDGRTTWSIYDSSGTERDIVRNNAGTWQYNSNGTYGSTTWTNATTNTEASALEEAMEGASQGYSVSNITQSETLDVSGQTSNIAGVAFNDDGTKFFVVDSAADDVNEYTLSTAWDVSSASFVDAFSMAGQDTDARGLAFNTDGTKMFMSGGTGVDINEYTLSTGFDVSTASFVDSFSVAGQVVLPHGLAFNTDGTKMFVVDASSDDVNEYTLSTGFDVSTASFVDAFSVTSQESSPYGLAFNSDGTEMYVSGGGSNGIVVYSLSTGFDVSTASYASINKSTVAGDIAVGDSGRKFVISTYFSTTVTGYDALSYTNQMPDTTLNALTDAQLPTLGTQLDLAAMFNMTSGATFPSYSVTSIGYDANTLNEGAVRGTDYDYDFPATNKVRITALISGNFKVRVV